jgi:hypothetical protein
VADAVIFAANTESSNIVKQLHAGNEPDWHFQSCCFLHCSEGEVATSPKG